MVKIPYAKNQNGEKVFVEDANKKDTYTCLECGQPLILRAGEYVVKHFAHFRAKKLCPLLTRKEQTNMSDKQGSKSQKYTIYLAQKITVPVHTGWIWATRKAVLKPINLTVVDNCPVKWMESGKSTSAQISECYACPYFREVRYPIDNESSSPPVVVCHGHFAREADVNTIFDLTL